MLSIHSDASSDSNDVLLRDMARIVVLMWILLPVGCDASPEFETLDVGAIQLCGLTPSGRVQCRGTDGEFSTPPISSNRVRQVRLGAFQSCALTRDGDVECWDPDGDTSIDPPSKTFRQIDVGMFGHACGITPGDALHCWSSGERSPPVRSPEGSFRDVAIGMFHVCALETGGRVTCWDQKNQYGQADPPSTTFEDITAGAMHNCGIEQSGELHCWGYGARGVSDPPNRYEMLDEAPDEGAIEPPDIEQIAAGYHHTCALASNGHVRCWGFDDDGQSTPPSSMTFERVRAGAHVTCGLSKSGELVCWGDRRGASDLDSLLRLRSRSRSN